MVLSLEQMVRVWINRGLLCNFSIDFKQKKFSGGVI